MRVAYNGNNPTWNKPMNKWNPQMKRKRHDETWTTSSLNLRALCPHIYARPVFLIYRYLRLFEVNTRKNSIHNIHQNKLRVFIFQRKT